MGYDTDNVKYYVIISLLLYNHAPNDEHYMKHLDHVNDVKDPKTKNTNRKYKKHHNKCINYKLYDSKDVCMLDRLHYSTMCCM